jgi:hypothetical protein
MSEADLTSPKGKALMKEQFKGLTTGQDIHDE